MELTPYIKWAGNKMRTQAYTLPIYNQYRDRRVVDVFCGALGSTFSLMPKHVLANDINPHIINLHTQVKYNFELDIYLKNDKLTYYQHRYFFNQMIDRDNWANSLESAQYFYYLLKTCYRGLCRFNSGGKFNVPYGRYKNIQYLKSFSKYSTAMKNWDFTCQDFSELTIEENDFIVIDPPYDDSFTGYYGSFDDKDQVRLVKWLSQFNVPIIAHNLATDKILGLYNRADFDIKLVKVHRSIGNLDRSPALEMLATKNINI